MTETKHVASMISIVEDREERRVHWITSIPFFAMHVTAVVGLYFFELTWQMAALVAAMYVVRMFGVTGGYHRYFAHRTYKTGRVMQFLLAVLAQTSAQKGALWWASHHRVHHRLSDKEGDVHSVKRDGFFWSHVGWILSTKWEHTHLNKIRDFARYPELVWLNKYHLVPPLVVSGLFWGVGGLDVLYWGMCVSTVLLWHGTFTINSLTHLIGKRRYATTDESRNHWFLAIITMGEGWHNNHHYYQRSTAQGFYWWEFDPTFYILKVLEKVGLVWDVTTVPAHVRDANHIKPAEVPAKPAACAEAEPIDTIRPAALDAA